MITLTAYVHHSIKTSDLTVWLGMPEEARKVEMFILDTGCLTHIILKVLQVCWKLVLCTVCSDAECYAQTAG